MHGGIYSVKQESLNSTPRGLPVRPMIAVRRWSAVAPAALIFAAMKKLLLAFVAAPLLAHAQAWPAKPIRWVVPYTGGGITDVVTRVVTQKMQGPLGQPIVVDNRPGANSILGSEIVAKAAPDGYTILTVIAGYAANVTILSCLFGPGDLVILDRNAHRSMYDGALQSGATIRRFRHNDVGHLKRLLSATREQNGALAGHHVIELCDASVRKRTHRCSWGDHHVIDERP